MKIFKQIIKGMFVAITGAFAWAVLAFELSEKGSGESRLLFCFWIVPLAAAYAVLITMEVCSVQLCH